MLGVSFKYTFNVWIREVCVGDDGVRHALRPRIVCNALQPCCLANRIGIVIPFSLNMNRFHEGHVFGAFVKVTNQPRLLYRRVVTNKVVDRIGQPRVRVVFEVPEVVMRIDKWWEQRIALSGRLPGLVKLVFKADWAQFSQMGMVMGTMGVEAVSISRNISSSTGGYRRHVL